MNAGDFLRQATQKLQNAGIETARLDCLVLLEDVIRKDRAWLLAHPEYKLTSTQQHDLESQIARREQYEPLAYIRSKAEFYGREFYVDSRVLVPRPESESFIDLLKNYALNKNFTQILDLGTGSGCLGLTAVAELPQLQLTLADIDRSALMVARKNAERLRLRAVFKQSDLLNTISGHYYIIITNLPYVPDQHPVNKPVAFEPKLALYAGPDGMDMYRHFWHQVHELREKPRLILTESLAEQHEIQARLATNADFKLTETHGLVQLFTPPN